MNSDQRRDVFPHLALKQSDKLFVAVKRTIARDFEFADLRRQIGDGDSFHRNRMRLYKTFVVIFRQIKISNFDYCKGIITLCFVNLYI
uniref:Uncharacterized protein n=1 Tax=uncultured Pyrinomonadaceae bacterium TaxID=2283094 RepID=A0A6J4P051_9BACT|nr:MAG: hypothetical protein AVDCRST_MAG74-1714 [uncultured Pyrinomonadaceae bacterium]